MVKEFFLDGVALEPGDRAQAACNRRTGPASGLQVPGEALDVSAAHLERAQVMLTAPAGELAEVQRVGLAGQPAVTGQEPGERQTFRAGECRLGGERGQWMECRWRSSGTSQVGLRPGRQGQPTAPAMMRTSR